MDRLVPRISILLNKDNIVQIGDEILYLRDSIEYIIPNENLALLKEVKDQLLSGNKVNISSVKVFPIKIAKFPLNIQNDSTSSLRNARTSYTIDSWVDSRYQYQFYSPGGTKMKFRISASMTLDAYSTYFQTILVLEYLKVRTIGSDQWLQAGEWSEKHLYDLKISYKTDPANTSYHYHDFAARTNGDGLNKNTLDVASTLSGTRFYDINIIGDYYAKITQPGWFPYSYHVPNATWHLDRFGYEY